VGCVLLLLPGYKFIDMAEAGHFDAWLNRALAAVLDARLIVLLDGVHGLVQQRMNERLKTGASTPKVPRLSPTLNRGSWKKRRRAHGWHRRAAVPSTTSMATMS